MSGPPEIGDVVAEKYAIEGVLGQGGMGTVFAARHVLTDRRVALKWMVPDTKNDPLGPERFLREARAMGRIDHPRVVGVMDVGQDGPATFIVMERLRGDSLRARMSALGPVAPALAVQLLLPAMEGLAAAHRLGIVHRDLKPENLFLVKDGDVESTKVLDFGISKFQVDPGDGSGSVTQSGVTMGTPSYMSPEQVRGSRDVDGRTDVWAIGVILHELLAGTPPFRAESYGALLIAIATEAPSPLPDAVPEALREIVERTLHKDPDRRFPTVEALAEALLPFGGSGASFRATDAESFAPPMPTPIPRRSPQVSAAITSSPTRGALPQHLAVTRAAGAPHRTDPPSDPTNESGAPSVAPRTRPPLWPVIGALAIIGVVTALALASSVPDATPAAAAPASPSVAPSEPVAVPVEPAAPLAPEPPPAVEERAELVAPTDVAEVSAPGARSESRRPRRPATSTAGDDADETESPEVHGRSGTLSRDDF